MSRNISDTTPYTATILTPDDVNDRRLLEELGANPRIEFIDRWDEQAGALQRLRPLPDPDLLIEPHVQTDEELREFSPLFAATLHALRSDLRELVATEPGESAVLPLRFSAAPPTSVRSRRHSV